MANGLVSGKTQAAHDVACGSNDSLLRCGGQRLSEVYGLHKFTGGGSEDIVSSQGKILEPGPQIRFRRVEFRRYFTRRTIMVSSSKRSWAPWNWVTSARIVLAMCWAGSSRCAQRRLARRSSP